jgi:hypothetical protein
MRAIFVTCCILNNMILRADGLNDLWESEENWTTLNADGNDDETSEAAEDGDAERVDEYLPVRFVPRTFNPAALADIPSIDYHPVANSVETDFHTLRDLLARQLHYTYLAGKLRWPKMHYL